MVEIKEKLTDYYFDYEKLAKKYGVDKEKLNNIKKEAFDEFSNDKMLAELHIVRALKKYKDSE